MRTGVKHTLQRPKKGPAAAARLRLSSFKPEFQVCKSAAWLQRRRGERPKDDASFVNFTNATTIAAALEALIST